MGTRKEPIPLRRMRWSGGSPYKGIGLYSSSYLLDFFVFSLIVVDNTADIDDHPPMRYDIRASVNARGTQYYEIEADSEQDALKKFNDGGGEFVDEDIEVTDIEDVEIFPQE